jgi:hypothetical protein
MISPHLHDFWPVFLLVFSPLETADFLMLFKLPGDGYSLLCSKKQPPWHKESFGVSITPKQKQKSNLNSVIEGTFLSFFRKFRVVLVCFSLFWFVLV